MKKQSDNSVKKESFYTLVPARELTKWTISAEQLKSATESNSSALLIFNNTLDQKTYQGGFFSRKNPQAMIPILISYGLLMIDNRIFILFPYENFLKGRLPSVIAREQVYLLIVLSGKGFYKTYPSSMSQLHSGSG